jgi:hypothetical protein
MAEKEVVREIRVDFNKYNDIEYVINHTKKIKYTNKTYKKKNKPKLVKILR